MIKFLYNYYIKKAKKCYEKSDFHKACVYFEKAFKYGKFLNHFFMYCESLYNVGRSKEVICELEDIDNRFGKDFFYAAYCLAKTYEDIDIQKTKSYLLRIVNNGFKDPDVYYYLSNVYKVLNDEENELKYAKLLYDLDNESVDANLKLATIYNLNDEYDKALPYAIKAYENSHRSYPRACLELAICYQHNGKKEESLDLYQKYLKVYPTSYECYFLLGLLYGDEFNDYDNAIECCRKAIEIEKNDGSCWYNLACFLSEINKLDEAFDCFYAAIGLDNTLYDHLLNDIKDKGVQNFIASKYFSELKNKLNIE